MEQKNEGEGNKTSARRYDAAATQHAATQDTAKLARSAAAQMDELLTQLRHFDVGMMVTHRMDGRRAARPMYVADIREGGALRFLARRDAGALEEIEQDPEVVITFQRGARYLSLTAVAHVVDDAAEVARCFRETLRLWFPDGPSTKEAVVITISPLEAEYWDQSGIESIRLFFQAARALLQREPLASKSMGKHGHVQLAAMPKSTPASEPS